MTASLPSSLTNQVNINGTFVVALSNSAESASWKEAPQPLLLPRCFFHKPARRGVALALLPFQLSSCRHQRGRGREGAVFMNQTASTRGSAVCSVCWCACELYLLLFYFISHVTTVQLTTFTHSLTSQSHTNKKRSYQQPSFSFAFVHIYH